MSTSYQSDEPSSTSTSQNPDTIGQSELGQNAQKHAGFSELPIRVPQESLRSSKGVPKETHKSSSAFAPLDARALDSLISRAASLEQRTTAQGKSRKQKALAHRIYADLLPRFVRLLRGAGYEQYSVDTITVIEIFEKWYGHIRENADLAGYDTAEGLPCSDEILGRLDDMWSNTFAREHDWLSLSQSLVACRGEYVTSGAGQYPETLRQLEDDLVNRQIGMRDTDAAGVLVAWTMAATHPDGLFFLAERDAGQLVCAIAGKRLEDMEHARIIGRTMLKKLVRLGIIEVIAKGKAWTKTDRNTKATTYRWIWGASGIRN